MNIIEYMCDKCILIWGYGVEGKSTERFLKKFCKVKHIDIYEGKYENIIEDNYDLIIKSPGIVMEEDNEKYTSQTELFLGQFRDQTIGVTGTKGKSTTSTMLYTVLKRCCDNKVLLLGNIGCPCLDYYEEISEETIIVYEMSCHQLAHTKLSPHIAVFLNFYEEHLDYYGTMEKYFNAKCNITVNQQKEDILLLGENVPEIKTLANVIKIHKSNDFELLMNGIQNQYNAEFIYFIAVNLFGLNCEKVKYHIERFSGLPHRLEYLGTKNGVRYYDDSISTIPEATIYAIESIDNVQTVLIGGKDRHINYDKLTYFIREHPHIHFICMYDSGKRIYDALSDISNCNMAVDLKDAVKMAKELSIQGSACLLSPAAASYGEFRNFEDRGDKFRKFVFNDTKDD